MNRLLTHYSDIQAWLEQQEIQHYTITENGIVNVQHSVDLSSRKLTFLPVQFGVVQGNFDCSHNQLNSLKGTPSFVAADFTCFSNRLSSLEHGPRIVSGSFNCASNQLTTLQYLPEKIGDNFECGQNLLTSLLHCPQTIEGDFGCSMNSLTSLEHGPENVWFSYDCADNRLISLKHIASFGENLECQGNPLTNIDELCVGHRCTLQMDNVGFNLLLENAKELSFINKFDSLGTLSVFHEARIPELDSYYTHSNFEGEHLSIRFHELKNWLLTEYMKDKLIHKSDSVKKLKI